MTRNRVFHSIPMVLAALAAVTLGGSDPPDLVSVEPFVCTQADCPDGSCKLRVSFAADCAGQIGNAEVLLNGALEPQFATVGSLFVSVGDVPVGTTAEFYIRAASWQWGQPPQDGGLPLTFDCKVPDSDGRFTLSCTKNSDGAGEAAPAGEGG